MSAGKASAKAAGSVKTFEEIDSLSLLAHKVAANVFDLSSEQLNVSIRDQIVRSQHLVRDLRRADPDAKSIFIVGMGVAGMTAALAACEIGFKTVCVAEIKSRPFDMFHGVTSRYVGPYMYEWPSPFHARQSYPSHYSTPWSGQGHSPLAWEASKPVSADELAKLLEQGVKHWWTLATNAKPYLLVDADRNKVREFVLRFASTEKIRGDLGVAAKDRPAKERFNKQDLGPDTKRWSGTTSAARVPVHFQPDYVILAAGMGIEILDIPHGPPNATPSFWANDDLKNPVVANQRTVVLGGGDGAIQDTLRALTTHHHPSSFIEELEAVPAVRQALEHEMPALLSADRQLRQHVSWSRDLAGYPMVDEACRQAARRLAGNIAVSQRVLDTMRTGTGEVLHFVRGKYFEKAYLLNRFVIYLLSECIQPGPRNNRGRMGFTLTLDREVKKGDATETVPTKFQLQIAAPSDGLDKAHALPDIDQVVVRFGIHTETVPGLQLIQLTEDDKDRRQGTTLKRVELPFVAMK